MTHVKKIDGEIYCRVADESKSEEWIQQQKNLVQRKIDELTETLNQLNTL